MLAYRLRHARFMLALNINLAGLLAFYLFDDPGTMSSMAGWALLLGFVLVATLRARASTLIFVITGLVIAGLFVIAHTVVTGALGTDGDWLTTLIAVVLALAGFSAMTSIPVGRVHVNAGSVAIAQPLADVWDAYFPVDTGDYWKPGMKIVPVGGTHDEFRAVAADGSDVVSVRYRLRDVERHAGFLLETLPDAQEETNISGDCLPVQVVNMEAVSPAVTRVYSTLADPNATVNAYLMNWCFDAAGDELRRFKALMEGDADHTFGSQLFAPADDASETVTRPG
ncbi:MAG: hypothetical protein AAFO79_05720 [Pseudomonadota bacterium]